MEKRGIIGESKKPGRRPEDVTILTWCEGKGLVLMCVNCPFSSSNLNRDSPAEYVAAHVKYRKYASMTKISKTPTTIFLSRDGRTGVTAAGTTGVQLDGE